MKTQTTSTTTSAAARCSRCGAPFHCGRDDPDGCWCARLPALPPARYDAAAGCLCDACLHARLAPRAE